ncbi:hypothetical protein ABZ714_13040 [Streptomyces sp. NPDC006798]|uniref:hypothetical protein n=1 Tax=Streptomyces sp. NPDC006798 TaxID=3155462 RepID=UPI0033CB3EFD
MIKDFVHHITSEMVTDCDASAAEAVARKYGSDGDDLVTQSVMDQEHARLLVCLQADMDDRFSELVERMEVIVRQLAALKLSTLS